MTVLAVPILVADNVPRATASATLLSFSASGQVLGEAAAEADDALAQQITAMTAVPAVPAQAGTTASPTQPPATEPPATTSTPPPTTEAPTTSQAPTTQPPTTQPPAPPTTQRAAHFEVGDASWYDYHPGSCAHPYLPFGTVITVTSLASGASTTCTVGDRGPTVPGRVIDLEREVFARLAPPSLGVISVRISW